MPVAHAVAAVSLPAVEVVAVLLADVEHVVGGAEIGHHPDREVIAGVVQVPAPQHADHGHREVVHVPLQLQPAVALLLLLVVVDVGVAGKPATLGQVRPALQRQLQVDVLGLGDGEVAFQRHVLGAALDQHPHPAGRHRHLEAARAVERGGARSHLEHRAVRMDEPAVGGQHVHRARRGLAAGGVGYHSSDRGHRLLLGESLEWRRSGRCQAGRRARPDQQVR